MAVLPVSSVDVNSYNNSVHFGQKAHKNEDTTAHQPKHVSKMVTIPLATLMALMPLANGAGQGSASAQTKASEQTELLAQNTTRKSNYPFDHGYFVANNRILHTERFSYAGKMQTMVFARNLNSNYLKGNEVNGVYIIPDGYKTNSGKTPPQVAQLVYHNLGPGKEYCGAIVHEDFYESEDPNGFLGDYKGTYISEYKLSEKAANALIDMLAGESKLKNKTGIKFIETTNPNRAYPVYKNKLTGQRIR